MMTKKQTKDEWWEEDAERLNKMAEFAYKKKFTVKVGKKLAPPKLRSDGVIITAFKDLIEFLKNKK